MDFIAHIPDVFALVMQILAVVGGSAVAAAILPRSSTGIAGLLRKILDYAAQNYGNAKNG